MDPLTKQDLIAYVKDQKTTEEGNKRIKEFCEKQTPVSTILYRGHKKSTEIRYNSFWYSATKSKQVAKEEFSSGNCCIFTVNLTEVPVIDINKFIGNEIGEYFEEQEFIFLGGGTFYKDQSFNQKGFLDKGNGEFECWYKFDKKEPFNIDRILDIIPEEEYDFIDEPSDIMIGDLSESQKILVFNKIQQFKLQKNGGKKSRKNKKIRKKKTRKYKKKTRKYKKYTTKL